MVFKNLCVLVLWTTVALALERSMTGPYPTDDYATRARPIPDQEEIVALISSLFTTLFRLSFQSEEKMT